MKSRKQSVTLRLARSLGSWPATTPKHAARLEPRRTALVDGNATQKSRRSWTATTAPRSRSHRAGQSDLRGAKCVVHENPSAPRDTLVRGHAQRLAHRGRGAEFRTRPGRQNARQRTRATCANTAHRPTFSCRSRNIFCMAGEPIFDLKSAEKTLAISVAFELLMRATTCSIRIVDLSPGP